MYESKLAGSVEQYERHLFLCYKSHESWPTRVEKSDADPLPKLLASALRARKDDIKLKTRLTICEAGDNGKLSDGDVLIFPKIIVYRCGVCDPILIEKFKEEIGSKDLKKHVSYSHVHKYAGNVIIFSATPNGKIAGN
ncbi:hypothetical protein MIMGU_mgv1a018946mg, partial [Erythranthe guttata]